MKKWVDSRRFLEVVSVHDTSFFFTISNNVKYREKLRCYWVGQDILFRLCQCDIYFIPV